MAMDKKLNWGKEKRKKLGIMEDGTEKIKYIIEEGPEKFGK